jgi:hypothetical protein
MTPSSFKITALVLTLALAAGCQKKPAGEKAAEAGKAGADASATVPGPAAGLATPPRRKPGLWKQSVTMGQAAQITRLCLDAATEAKISMWGAQATKEMCKTNQMSRQLDGSWKFVSECDMGGGGRITTTGVATGDFGSSYQMTADSVTTGASSPQMNGAHKMVIQATWEGPCPAGFKPGDMELPGGMKINMLDMAKAGK